jgi:hypothetical protein
MEPSQEERISFVLSNLQKHGAAREGFPPPPKMHQYSEPGGVGARRRAPLHIDENGCEAAIAAAAVGSVECDIDMESGEFHGNTGASAHHQHATGGGMRSGPTFVDARRITPVTLKGRSCLSVGISGLWAMFVILFVVLALVQMHHFHMFEYQIAEDPAFEKRLARDGTIRDSLCFGVWDSQRKVTPLQLQVAVSMALGVRADDDDIHVRVDENYFFEVLVQHATIEEVEYAGSDTFLAKLNAHLLHYGGSAVMSHPPKLQKPVAKFAVERAEDS